MIAIHDKTKIPMPQPRSTHLGYDAGRFGMPLTLNPYKPGSAKARLWIKAWRDGVEKLLLQRETALEQNKKVEREEERQKRGGKGEEVV